MSKPAFLIFLAASAALSLASPVFAAEPAAAPSPQPAVSTRPGYTLPPAHPPAQARWGYAPPAAGVLPSSYALPPGAVYAPAPGYAPAAPASDPGPVMVTKRRSPGAIYAGAVFAGLGAVSLVASMVFVLKAGAEAAPTICWDRCNRTSGASGSMDMAVGFLTGGVIGAAVGIPLIIYGASKVRKPFARLGTRAGSGWAWRF